MKKLLFSVLSLLMFCIGMKAQTNIANYKFASSVGTYVPLTGATTFLNVWDDQVSASIPLGGNFTYGAVTYTACFINANGYITFGASQTGYNPLSTNTASAAISAFGRDGASSVAPSAAPSISYMNIGGATGEFVVEYKDHATYGGNGTERLNTQIRLDLATGTIKFVYGSWTAPAGATNAQVGIRGNTVNWLDNVNSLTTIDAPTGTSCTWANAVNSNANSSTMLFSTANLAVVPSNGLTYTWSQPVNATLAPVRTFTAVTGIATTSATIGWTAPTGATQYNIQYRTPGSCTWTNFSGNPVATNTATLTGLTQATIYQIRVQSNDGSNNAIWSHIPDAAGTGNGYSASGTFSTLPTCPVPTTLNTSTITGTTANFTWTAGGTETAWDVYYGPQPLTAPTASTAATATTSTNSYSAIGLASGSPYSVYVRANCGSGDVSTWTLVKNFNTLITCAVPTALNTSTITGATANFTWTSVASAFDVYYGPQPLTAPTASTAATATTATNSYSATGLSSGTPHSVYVRANCGSGDLSTWTLVKNFTTVITCTVPTAVTISNITSASATFSWTSVATAFDVYYGLATTVPNATTVPTATTATKSYSATGLSASTAYSVYVRANCGAGDVSTWTAVKIFTTLCNSYTTFPYTESFSATFPSCWSASEGTTGASYHWEPFAADPTYGVAGPKAGTNFMRLYVYLASTTYNTYNLTTPSFSLGTSVKQIKYNYFLGNNGYKGTTGAAGSDPYPLALQVSTNGGTTWTSIYNHSTSNSVFASSNSTANWQSNIVTLGSYTNQTAIFRFASNSNYSSGICNQAIDEFIIEDAPACVAPTAYTSTGITATTAMFTWTAGASETAWDIFVGSNPTATTVPTATTSATSYTATGLSVANTYSVYVRANCGGSTSTWVLSTVTIDYCTPAPTSVDGTGITNVTIAPTINNTTGAEVGNYGNYSAQVANVTQSLPTTIYITHSTGYAYGMKVWVDFNNDLDFNDVGEELYSGTTSAVSPSTSTVTINIPLTAPLGTHRLRIGSLDGTVVTPCYNGTYGSFEDYSINVLVAPSCIPTSPITISAITPISAIASWTAAGTETAWDVYYGVTPLTAPTATTVPTTTSSATSYTMSGLTPSSGYNVYVRANCGSGDLSIWTAVSAFMTPCLPPNIVSIMGGTRCGNGTTTLTATADMGGTINWYANATGGSAIATGTLFTTPTITNNTTYYASAVGSQLSETGARVAPTATANTTPSSYGLVFNATKNFVLTSVDVFPTATAGNLVVNLTNSTGTVLQTTTVAIPSGTVGTAFTVPLNFNVSIGTGYRLIAVSGPSMIRESSLGGFPYPLGSAGSITDGYISGTSTSYYYFYNWQFTSGCESARSMVTATVTAPAVLSVTSGTTICANAIKTLSVTSTVGDFDSYTWTPNTYLYTDAAATTSYTGGTASTLYYTSSAISNTTYTINATNSVNGCANQTSTFMMSDMPVIYASVNPSVVCLSNSVTLTANTDAIGAGIVNVGSGSLATTASGSSTGNNVSPFSHYYGGYKAQYIIRASELTAAGLFAGNITSLSYSVTAAGITYTDFAIGIAATTQSVANTTFNGSAVVAYGPSSATPTVGLNTYNFTTPFNWDGTSNVVVAICWSNNNSGGTAAEVAYDATSFPSTSYARSDMQTSSAMCGSNTVSGTLSNRPLLIFAGQRNTPSVGTVNWTWNPGAIPTNTAIITPTVAGPQSYTVTAVDPVTTCSNSAVVTVTVNAAPTLTATTSNTTVCAGSSATLTAMGTATNFTWTSGGNAMTTVVTPTAASVYTVTASTTGCSAITATVSVGVNAVPSVTATATSTLLCSNLGESAIVSWTDGVNTLTTSVTPTVATTYTFAINDGTCIGQTTIFIDVQTCTAINSLVKSGAINIFPNPTNGILNIAISAELAGATSIELYDAVGKLVIKEALSNENTTINTSKLTDGMYFYKVINNNKAINIGKIVKH